jgi:hypothetical protein
MIINLFVNIFEGNQYIYFIYQQPAFVNHMILNKTENDRV